MCAFLDFLIVILKVKIDLFLYVPYVLLANVRITDIQLQLRNFIFQASDNFQLVGDLILIHPKHSLRILIYQRISIQHPTSDTRKQAYHSATFLLQPVQLLKHRNLQHIFLLFLSFHYFWLFGKCTLTYRNLVRAMKIFLYVFQIHTL